MKKKPFFLITSAHTLDDMTYIGDPKMANKLWRKFGIEKFETADSSHKVASIGFSPRDQKWYGWSHRAIYGFTIGDIVKEGDCCTSSGFVKEYAEQHPEMDKSLPVGFKAETMADAKRMAIAFAASVS